MNTHPQLDVTVTAFDKSIDLYTLDRFCDDETCTLDAINSFKNEWDLDVQADDLIFHFATSINSVDVDCTLPQAIEIVNLDCEERVFLAAMDKYSNDVEQAIRLVEGGYSIEGTYDEILDLWLEGVVSDKNVRMILRNAIDDDYMTSELCSDYTEMSDGRYISWYR